MICLPIPVAIARVTIPPGDVRHERGVVYGQAGTRPLVMDVFTPTQHARHRAMLFMISGGFWSNPETLEMVGPLLERLAHDSGYTVIAVVHGSQPEFIIPEIIPQVARAVRFVRAGAARFGIDPDHIGITGFSSGGFLSLSMATRGDDGDPQAADPVERVSSHVQAAVAFFPPTDFLNYGRAGNSNLGQGDLGYFRGAFFHAGEPLPDIQAYGRQISPIYWVGPGAAPVMLIHGDQDHTVPLQQSQIFQAAMRKAGVECELIVRKGVGHGWMDMQPELRASIGWFNRHLAAQGAHS